MEKSSRDLLNLSNTFRATESYFNSELGWFIHGLTIVMLTMMIENFSSCMQVCSTWREVSRSDLLWEHLTRRIWRRTFRVRDTWHREYINCHRTARNFEDGRLSSSIPQFGHSEHRRSLICRCLVLSDTRLACGFVDGTVRVFDLETNAHVSTFLSDHGHLFGPFSRSISGIVITDSNITFARLDGDIYVDAINVHGQSQARRAVSGFVMNNGPLVGFAGTRRWWVGLFAGIAGRSFQVIFFIKIKNQNLMSHSVTPSNFS